MSRGERSGKTPDVTKGRAGLALGLVVVAAACAGGDGGDGGDDRGTTGETRAENCSAAAVDPDTALDPVLPEPVARTKVEIIEAAAGCDYDALDELAGEGVEVDWEAAEDDGEPALAALVEVLDGPLVLDGDVYVWPGVEEGSPRAAITADGIWWEYDDGTGTGAGTPDSLPAEVVAALDGEISVISSETGGVVRSLVDGDFGSTAVAVSPDGLVYFERPDPDVLCGEDPAAQIASVPIDGGDVLVVASGSQPAVSPDGEWLAYLSGAGNQCGPPTQVVVQPRDTATFTQQLHPLDDGASTELLAWSPGSDRLLYADAGELREITPESDAAAPLTGGAGPAKPAAYLEGGELAVVDADDAGAVVALDAAAGEARPLFRLEGVTILDLVADPSGRHLLVRGEDPSGPASLHRWSPGGEPEPIDAGPTGGVAWVPVVSGR